MDRIDDKTQTAIGDSVATFDPLFAQSREPVDHATPAREAAIREGERLREAVERLSARLAALQSANAPQAALDRVERELNAAVDRWTEYATADDPADAAAAVPSVEAPGMGEGGYFSIADLLRRDLDTGRDLDEREMEIRLAALRAFNLFAFQDGVANIWLAFKNWLAVVRRSSPEFLDGISKADLALLLGETRAATCDREIRIVEKFLIGAGVRGFQLLGGNKRLATRRKCAESAKGNQNRKGREYRARNANPAA